MKKSAGILFVAIFSLAVVTGYLLLFNSGTLRNHTNYVAPTREQQLWCLAACAVLTQRNHDRHDLLGGAERSDKEINAWMGRLAESWDVEDRATLYDSLRWIEAGGHRRHFLELAALLSTADARSLKELESEAARNPELNNKIEIVRTYYAELGDKSLVGWDFSRYLSLCGWGYLVGYIPEDEAWSLMMPAARLLQGTFDSWEDLGKNYLIGRAFWSQEQTRSGGDRYRQEYDWLRTDPESPWLNIPWDLDLGAEGDGDTASADDTL